MIFQTQPGDFNSKFDVVSCFVENGDKILLLLRQDHKPQGNSWGIPAGKVNTGADLLIEMQRELQEETGLIIPPDKIEFVTKVYTRYPDYDFIFHIYRTKVDAKSEIEINPQEHKDYQWIKPKDVFSLSNQMEDLDNCIDLIYSTHE